MDVGRLLDGEVTLVDGAEALRPVAQLLFQRDLGEQLHDPLVRCVVERRVDAVAHEDGEAQAAERVAQLLGEGVFVGRVAVEKSTDVAGGDAGLLVEGLGVVGLGEVVLLPLVDLVVSAERLVRRLDALCLAVAHGEPSAPGADPTSARLRPSVARPRAPVVELTSRTRRPGEPVNRNGPGGSATASWAASIVLVPPTIE